MARALALISIALIGATTGCMAGHAGHGATMATRPETPTAGMAGMPMAACPMALPGTQLMAADTPDGEAVTFTTTPDRVDDLRARVRAMAGMHNQHHAGGRQGGMMGGGMMGHGGPEGMGMMMPPSRAAMQDVEGGAQLVVTPNDPADLDRLRSTVRMHADRMRQTGSCEEYGHM